jgi:hypothetical protein
VHGVDIFYFENSDVRPDFEVHASNPTYLVGKDQEHCSFWANQGKIMRLHLKNQKGLEV